MHGEKTARVQAEIPAGEGGRRVGTGILSAYATPQPKAVIYPAPASPRPLSAFQDPPPPTQAATPSVTCIRFLLSEELPDDNPRAADKTEGS